MWNKKDKEFKTGKRYLVEVDDDDETKIEEIEIIQISPSGKYIKAKKLDGTICWWENDNDYLEELL